MNKFFKNLLLFSLILLLLNFIFLQIVNNKYFVHYKNHSLNFKSYLLADSHGLPLSNKLEKIGVYNFSAGSDSYFDMKIKLNYLIRNKKIDTIYISIDPHGLSPYREKSNNNDRSIFYKSISDYSNIFEFLNNKSSLYIVFMQPKSREFILQYFNSLLKRLFFTNHKIGINDKLINWSHYSYLEKKRKSLGRYNEQFQDTNTSKILMNELLEIINVCSQYNIKLIGVVFPLTMEYNKLVSRRFNTAKSIFSSNKLKIIDFADAFEHQSNLFENQDHLNALGGEKFAENIINEVKQK
jgi:hypothetical protein